jgi:hypothetical protein
MNMFFIFIKITFDDQQKRDQLKYDKCKELGITLILIPYEYSFKNPDEMKAYIKEELIRTGFIIEIEI